LEPDMELADLALGQGHDPDTVEAELLVEASDILLVAREPVEGLGDDQVEAAGTGVLQELLVPRPQPAGTGGRGVAVGRHQRPAFPVDALPADPHLVLDRRLPLEVRRIASIDHSTHGVAPWSESQVESIHNGLRSEGGSIWFHQTNPRSKSNCANEPA